MSIRKTFPFTNIYIYYFPHNVNFGNGSFVTIIEAAKMTPMGIEATKYLITQTAWREKSVPFALMKATLHTNRCAFSRN